MLIPALLTLLIIALVLLYWPERGLLARWQEYRRLQTRILGEDALKHLHRCEQENRKPNLEGIAGRLGISHNQAARIIAALETRGLVSTQNGEIRLTPAGREDAIHIIRAHRLWERYLADRTGYHETEWHQQAERVEHHLTQADADALAAQLGHPTHDPHGDPIPTREGELAPQAGLPLPKAPLNQPARIVHIEDEPDIIYQQLLAEGLYPGMQVRVTESSPQRVRFWTNGSEHVLAPLLANNISVAPLETAPPPSPGIPLSQLQPGQQATVVSLSPAIRGPERRRLMDLGLLPGTTITPEMRSPSGDPTAYRIRGALIALREEQTRHIQVEITADAQGRQTSQTGKQVDR